MGDGQRDVIAVLTDDHRRIEEMLERFDRLAPEDARARRNLADQVIIELVRHGAAEEQHLYPAVRRHLPGGDRIADKAVADQTAAEQIMKELERIDADDDRFDGAFARLALEVRRHVTDLENLVFPHLPAHCDRAMLESLGGRVRRAERIAPTRPHPSTPDTPPLNRLLDAGAGLVDRARDLVTGRGG